MTRVYNTLDAIAERQRAAIVVVHHSSKGNQSEKAVTDVGSGAGAQSRAADTHLVLRHHEQDDAVVVDAAVRSFKPLEPFVIRSTRPGWELAPGLDPTQLRSNKRSKKDQPEAAVKPVKAWSAESFATEVVGRENLTKEQLLDKAKCEHGLARAQAERLLKVSEAEGRVFRHRSGYSESFRFTIDKPDTLTP
jgi:hypothetical protein